LTSRTVENREVDDELYQLRVVEGRTWHDIGSRVGMSHEGARKRFHRNLGRGVTDEDWEQYRAEETEKLDQIESTYMEVARVALTAGKLRPVFDALDGRLKCHRERAKINGPTGARSTSRRAPTPWRRSPTSREPLRPPQCFARFEKSANTTQIAAGDAAARR
jgi:hypothetical protein